MLAADAVIAITHRCNARCTVCSVWQSKSPDRLGPAHLAKLPRSLRTINITGGEPFLHPRLPDFVAAARKYHPRAITTISTNGLLPERVRKLARSLIAADKHLRIAVSLDGLAGTHDHIRGLSGAFERAMQTIEHLKQIGFTGLRLSMTLCRQNSDQLLAVADLAEDLGLELGIVPAHASAVHFLTTDSAPPRLQTLLPELDVFICRLLRSARPKLWLRAHFAQRVKQFLTSSLPNFSCQAAAGFFFLQADGTIYPCNVCSPPLGNIIEDDFQKIWFSPAADSAREQLAKCNRRCWMVCTARSYYRTHLLEVILWIMAHKLRAHLQLLAIPALQG